MEIEKLNKELLESLKINFESKKTIKDIIEKIKSNYTLMFLNIFFIIWIIILIFSYIQNQDSNTFSILLIIIFTIIISNSFIILESFNKNNHINKNNYYINYIKNNYGIEEIIMNYSNFENFKNNKSIFEELFDLTKLENNKFIKSKNTYGGYKPILKFENNDFNIKIFYHFAYSGGKYGEVLDNAIITKTIFKKKINEKFIIKHNLKNGFIAKIKLLSKILINLFLRLVGLLIISLIYINNVIYYLEKYIFIIISIFLILGLINFIYLYSKISIESKKISINNLDLKYDLFLLNGNNELSKKTEEILLFLDNYSFQNKNEFKNYEFYIDGDCLYIKYIIKDLININDYILEYKNHIVLVKEFEKKFIKHGF